ncbi:hypothetical protein [Zunongwangia sp. HGR-M22]|uniref:hypothetical protein n=1 Tax=Zunongwangia sp. HGR-M22 TaxID=3015168 RepID=UPI0022DD0928|nr:hypothetical protein [Zunongwangia sp. HGR-M22]WBL25470.1 hypothetical protein PBT91_16435 [Zunongwangia sp. HGR-M22]
MKFNFLKKSTLLICALGAGMISSCSSDDDVNGIQRETPPDENSRWITVAAAKMGSNPGDGNGGTSIYSINSNKAKDPNAKIKPFDNGFIVPSNRTARLQSSADGNQVYNITYAGDTGGNFMKYDVNGGQDFIQVGSQLNISTYVGTAPRWTKLSDGQTGAAVYIATENIVDDNDTEDDVTDDVYVRTNSKLSIVTIDLEQSKVKTFKEYNLPLSEELEAQGYYIGRVDMPVLNAAGNKLYIGVNMRKLNPETLERERDFEALGSKTIVLDYPSLENPTMITSEVGHGSTNGYRSINAFEYQGSIYQANQGDPEGSHILRIGADNKYDDSYVFNLDEALGINEAYILAWRPAANGKAIVAYRHAGSAEGVAGQQGFFALADLNTGTAEKITDIPYDPDFYLFQYQGFVVDGTEIYLTEAPVGQNGNIYVVDTETGEVTKGAELVNVEGSHFIGVF